MRNLLLKWKIWRMESALKALFKDHGVKPMVWSFGAYFIDPKYLVFVIGVDTDDRRDEFRSSEELTEKMASLLRIYSWPEIARKHVAFDIESQETVNREHNGNWWYHYK